LIEFNAINLLPRRIRNNLFKAYEINECSFRAMDPSLRVMADRQPMKKGIILRWLTKTKLYHAEIDFAKFLISCCPTEVLYSYLATHGVTSLVDNERLTVEMEVKRILNDNINVVPPYS